MKRTDLDRKIRKAVDSAVQKEAERLRARIHDPVMMARMSLMYRLTEGL
jgi:hypothetical protein